MQEAVFALFFVGGTIKTATAILRGGGYMTKRGVRMAGKQAVEDRIKEGFRAIDDGEGGGIPPDQVLEGVGRLATTECPLVRVGFLADCRERGRAKCCPPAE